MWLLDINQEYQKTEHMRLWAVAVNSEPADANKLL